MFFYEPNKFNNLKPENRRTKDTKATVYDNTSELYNVYLEIYFDQYMSLSDAKERKLGKQCDSKTLFIDGYNYSVLSEIEEESTDKEELTDATDAATRR